MNLHWQSVPFPVNPVLHKQTGLLSTRAQTALLEQELNFVVVIVVPSQEYNNEQSILNTFSPDFREKN